MEKQIIVIGEGCWFIDSFKYFIEKGFSIKMIKTSCSLPWFKDNYEILRKLGAEIIEYADNNTFYQKLNLSKQTIILCGGNFCGDVPSFSEFTNIGIEELDLLYNISKYNKEKLLGAKVIRYFNGDTCFGSKEKIDVFNKKIKYVDTLIFDNDLLKEFVLTNVPEANNKKILLGWVETPLKEFVHHNIDSKYERSFVSVGRVLSSVVLPKKVIKKTLFYPIPFQVDRGLKKIIKKFKHKFISKRKSCYSLAGMDRLDNILQDRKVFYKTHKNICFGLSHFYDIFRGSIEEFHKQKQYFFSVDGQRVCSNIFAPKEAFYAFINNPSKDIGYLMNGIIPLISHTEHNVYKEMVNKKMAILIKKPEDILNVLNMSNEEIQEYRDNIYKNRDLFTFDHVGEMIIKELED